MRHANTDAAYLTGRGWAHTGLPPLFARGRRLVAALAMIGCVVGASACTSSHAAGPRTGPTALVIPPPFEIHQQVGFGAVTILVDSFARDGDAVTVDVEVKNETPAPLLPSREPTFSIFYDTGLHASRGVTGVDTPIPANGTAKLTLEFTVPAKYRYPLVWFASAQAGTGPDDVILRGTHS